MKNYIINFFKSVDLYDEDIFNDIKKNTTIVYKNYDDIKDIVGCYLSQSNDKVKLILPAIVTIKDVLIHIHEYTHAITKSEDEILPNMLEALFIKEYFNKEDIINSIIEETQNEIDRSVSSSHTFAKKLKLKFIKNS